MQIHNLPAQTSAANTDTLAIDNGTTTQKITAANLGKKVTEDATPAFTSADSTTANAWTSVAALASGETMKSILNKVSTMFKNIRYLYKMLGTTDISSLSDAGTVTAALSKLNTDYEYVEKRAALTSSSIDDFCTQVLNTGTSITRTCYVAPLVTQWLTDSGSENSGKGFVTQLTSTIADVYLSVDGVGTVYVTRFNPTAKTITTVTKKL